MGRRGRTARASAAVVGAVVVAMGLAACGREGSALSSGTPSPRATTGTHSGSAGNGNGSPQGSLARLVEASATGVRSARLTFSERSLIVQAGHAYRGSVTGAGVVSLSSPAELSLTLVASMPGLGRQLDKVIVIGPRTWTWVSGLDYPGGRDWTESPSSREDELATSVPMLGSASAASLIGKLGSERAHLTTEAPVTLAGTRYEVIHYDVSDAGIVDEMAKGHAGVLTPGLLRRLERVYPGGLSGLLYVGPSDVLWRITERETTVGGGVRTTDYGTLTFSDRGLSVHLSPPAGPVVHSTEPAAPPTTTTSTTTLAASSKG